VAQLPERRTELNSYKAEHKAWEKKVQNAIGEGLETWVWGQFTKKKKKKASHNCKGPKGEKRGERRQKQENKGSEGGKGVIDGTQKQTPFEDGAFSTAVFQGETKGGDFYQVEGGKTKEKQGQLT